MPCERSSRSSTASATAGSVKLGQPVPLSNLASGRNTSPPPAAHGKGPWSLVPAYGWLNGRSVPCSRSTWYCSGVRRSRHSSSVRAASRSITRKRTASRAQGSKEPHAQATRPQQVPGVREQDHPRVASRIEGGERAEPHGPAVVPDERRIPAADVEPGQADGDLPSLERPGRPQGQPQGFGQGRPLRAQVGPQVRQHVDRRRSENARPGQRGDAERRGGGGAPPAGARRGVGAPPPPPPPPVPPGPGAGESGGGGGGR